ncbi:MAG: class I SAM-dependent methyltransferase [Caldilinea sp.]
MDADAHQKQQEARDDWDELAATFDEMPDHGLRDPVVLAAWTIHLAQWLPSVPTTVLDVGCGTGSLSVVLAKLGHAVTGIDFSPAMLAQAQAKAQSMGQQITFKRMDAAAPLLPAHRYGVVICRHVLWTLPEPANVLRRWVDLLTPGGRLVLIEGCWHTDAGLHARQVVEALPASAAQMRVEDLSKHEELWGGKVADERYAIVADF